ncbi:hypothetical protein [Candidatus Magnetaquicoccus inordinatus]|uniref:hypothetical protein n=1 Tax=Candidatus Magnetaquicoccus inordinatus TaxID=2496818 RepID=UPI00102AEC5E|nr:hypothetical protein [Candidatus Magnetaquicoccus inordinatus]
MRQQTQLPKIESTSSSAVVVLRAEEGQALIGRAVAKMPQVQARLQNGRMVIVGGTTTRHVVRALLGQDPGRDSFAVGWIRDALLGETPPQQRGAGPFLFEEGVQSRGWPAPLLERFAAGDIYIKGANAIDPQGNAAVLVASPVGGTIGAALAILMARGGELIVPVSLQKMIPSVPAACGLLGQGRVERVMGSPVGYMPLMAGSATLVTEVVALRQLCAVEATPVAAGGVDDCQAAQVLHLRGSAASIEQAWQLVLSIRTEIAESHPPVAASLSSAP